MAGPLYAPRSAQRPRPERPRPRRSYGPGSGPAPRTPTRLGMCRGRTPSGTRGQAFHPVDLFSMGGRGGFSGGVGTKSPQQVDTTVVRDPEKSPGGSGAGDHCVTRQGATTTKLSSGRSGIGEVCTKHQECQSECCVTNSLNSQKFCTSQTIFLLCLPWKKPLGYSCHQNNECQSSCCALSQKEIQVCTAQTVFLQCVPWRKPNMDFCSHHTDCRSRCCIKLTEHGHSRCVPQIGLITHCLPLVGFEVRQALPCPILPGDVSLPGPCDTLLPSRQGRDQAG
ncbi:PREDICTED: keratin-associated protein 10-8-like [Chrysochloris asiatica]|uniref:Keratin-associated protein 10-8-like n=1 Tax=Chrysochloris asiatica TaxID=185453 RepID=A0A9B0U5Z7_CHRAS|nr:PREDICTED: keratin-associated protein 10-8-like [Chrysochloris asiatica]